MQPKNMSSLTLPIVLLVVPPALALLELCLLLIFNPFGSGNVASSAIHDLPEFISNPILSGIAFMIVVGIPLTVFLGPPSMITGIVLLIIRLKGRKNAQN